MDTNEVRLQLAIDDYRNGVRAITEAHSVKMTTLSKPRRSVQSHTFVVFETSSIIMDIQLILS
jgi:hypothetical protein